MHPTNLSQLPSDSQIKFLQKSILSWFSTHGRKNLPWQENKTLYRVWVSEIMLQQTQVNTAIPYYLKFLNTFPDILTLANSPLDQVLSHWAGLGYYARARNLHKAAIQIKENYAGNFPDQLNQVLNLPGIGLSTASAILSISQNQPLAICDGNVKRVLSRLHCVNSPLNQSSTEKILWDLAKKYMPEKNCADYSQAIMDLGATLCTQSKPSCPICPLNSICQAYLTNTQTLYPIPKKPLIKKTKHLTFLIFYTSTHILLTQNPPTGIWGGLFTPLLLDKNPELLPQPINPSIHIYINQQKHVFTHFDLIYDAYFLPTDQTFLHPHAIWQPANSMGTLALPAPIKKLLKLLS